MAGWTCEAAAATRRPSNRSSPIWASAGRAASLKRTPPLNPAGLLRVNAQTIYYQENLAFSFAQSRISMVICLSLGFLVSWFSSFIDKTDLADFVCFLWRRWGEGDFVGLFVCKNYISLSRICLNIFFAMYNFERYK